MSIRFLVVDDDGDHAETLVVLLRLWGHAGDTATFAEDALKAAGNGRPNVAFIELMLPGTSGTKLSQLLREQWPDLFIVLMTGYPVREMHAEAQADALMRKPLDVAQLARVMESAEARFTQTTARVWREASFLERGNERPPKVIRKENAILRDRTRPIWDRMRATDQIAGALRKMKRRGRDGLIG